MRHKLTNSLRLRCNKRFLYKKGRTDLEFGRGNVQRLVLAAFLALAFLGSGIHSAFAAMGGCVDSPENPSLVLGLIAAGVALIPIICDRFRS